MKLDNRFFKKFEFSNVQIKKNIDNALKDLEIAKKDDIPEVKFTYTYNALIKTGIALLSMHQYKVKSMPGHQIKIIESLALILKDESIADIGNAMRSKRNVDFYGGGAEVTRKESEEYLEFVERVIGQVKKLLQV